jgi:uncharacterized membrane protein YcaP (DUF421 family)
VLASVVARLFTTGVPISEKIVRTIVVYLAVLLLVRLSGKRTAAQLNAFDLVVLLLLSNVVQNAIIGPDNSLWGGVIGAAVLVGTNAGVVRVLRRVRIIDRALEGSQARLVRDGAFEDGELRRFGIRESDLKVALRRQGAENVRDVENAELYPSGAIVVDLEPAARGASVGDVERLERKLDALLAAVGGPTS